MTLPDDTAAIMAAERAYLAARPSSNLWTAHRTGLALSGGGIRSATLSLGVLTSLSRLRLVKRFDYLSTVSGGGYTGAFYASLFVPPGKRGAAQSGTRSPTLGSDPLGTPDGEKALRHLRENGRYLLSGAGDAIRLAVIALRGWLAIHIVIGVALLAVFLFLKAVQASLLRWPRLQDWDVTVADHGLPRWLWPVEWLKGYPLDEIWRLSPVWPFAAASLVIAMGWGWAYWLSRYQPKSSGLAPSWPSWLGPSSVATAAIWFASVVWPFLLSTTCAGSTGFLCSRARALTAPASSILFWSVQFIGWLALAACVFYAIALSQTRAAPRPDLSSSDREWQDRVRTFVTGWAARSLSCAAGLAAFALIDTAAQTAYAQYIQNYHRGVSLPIAAGALIGLLTPLVRWAITKAQKSGKFGALLARFGRSIALLTAIVVCAVVAMVWAILAEYLAWQGAPIGGATNLIRGQKDVPWSPSMVWTPTLCLLVANLVIGGSIGFVNLSTFSAFYAGRLRRAYLGASNATRTHDDNKSIAQDDEGDDIALIDYYAKWTDSPLHLINVTVNETCGSGGSALVQRDRKGRPMTLSPAGYVCPEQDKLRRIPFSDRPGIDLPLSAWVGISGAAISTGLGQNTSLGLSLLAGLSNLRLGVWWTHPDVEKTAPQALRNTVQFCLANEFLGQFRGTSDRRWYLTDGGHFENTGVYELVRRRVALIVACDNGADPDYTFSDIVNLTRKLRIDFGAELDFLPADKLDLLLGSDTPNRGIFGELSDLVRRSRDKSSRGPYAAIARVRIRRDGFLGTLVLLKPRISGLEMLDLKDYHRSNPAFPQQTTGDQFFDEAQWESYFRLGETIAELVFTAPPPARQVPLGPEPPRWAPANLAPIDPAIFPWIADEWLIDHAPARPDGVSQAAAAAPAGAKDAAKPSAPGASSVVESIGWGRLLAGAAAVLGTAGVAGGLTQSLTNATINTPSSNSATMTLALSDADRSLLQNVNVNGGASDPRLVAVVGDLIARVNALIALLPAKNGLTPQPPIEPELLRLRLLLQTIASRQNPAPLGQIIMLLKQIRDKIPDNAPLLHEIQAIGGRVDALAGEVKNASPRRNIRGSQ